MEGKVLLARIIVGLVHYLQQKSEVPDVLLSHSYRPFFVAIRIEIPLYIRFENSGVITSNYTFTTLQVFRSYQRIPDPQTHWSIHDCGL